VQQASDLHWSRSDRLALAGALALAVAMRLLFFTGFFGSDEVTYTEQALATLRGNWPRGNYIGSIRYGVNLPVAAFLGLLGVNQAGAAAWAFVTSVGEIAVVYFAARYLAGARVALLSALVLAFLPLHVNLAGRLMADSPLALFITLTFVLFKVGQDRNDSSLFFLAGVAAGAVFWIKESVVIFLVCFLAYPVVFRTWNPRWMWMALGAALMFAANCLMFRELTGDPWHLIAAVRTSTDKFVAAASRMTSPFYYPYRLLVDLRHTWLLGPLALVAAILLGRSWAKHKAADEGMYYVLFWALGLLLVFSITVISVAPFKLIMKQTNYMTIFIAPLAILAGWLLSRLSRPALVASLSAVLVGSFVLAALEQQVIKVFTANSKAAVAFAQQHPDAKVYGTVNSQMAADFFDGLLRKHVVAADGIVRPLRELMAGGPERPVDDKAGGGDRPVFALVDLQTLGWGDNGIATAAEIPPCWRRAGELVPVREGAGRWIGEALLSAAQWLPDPSGTAVKMLAGVTEIRPAWIFAVPDNCKAAGS